jgi:cell division transport system permease protein
MRSLRYAFEEAFVNLRRAGRSAAMSVGTIAIAFLTLGLFLLTASNLQRVVDRWSAAAEMSIYLRDDIADEARQQLTTELTAHAAVEAVEYVTKEQALARFRGDFPELADIAAGSDENPFPASLEVRLRTDPASAGAADAMAELLVARPGVADVRYDPQWLTRLLAIVTGVRLAGLAIAAVLVLGAAFTLAAVVRLSLQARREELDIMQLVGAPFAFIRGPSIAEGTLLGGFGAALSLLLLWALFATIRGRLYETLAGFGDVGELRFLGLSESLLLVLAGLTVGALAGVVASRSVR